ncbi:hypothetical protein VIGAN_03181100, partial [Vigna angularis var. angularis]
LPHLHCACVSACTSFSVTRCFSHSREASPSNHSLLQQPQFFTYPPFLLTFLPYFSYFGLRNIIFTDEFFDLWPPLGFPSSFIFFFDFNRLNPLLLRLNTFHRLIG